MFWSQMVSDRPQNLLSMTFFLAFVLFFLFWLFNFIQQNTHTLHVHSGENNFLFETNYSTLFKNQKNFKFHNIFLLDILFIKKSKKFQFQSIKIQNESFCPLKIVKFC